MNIKKTVLIFLLAIVCILSASCGQKTVEEAPSNEAELADGVYLASFDTDSSMFHINEAHNGKGIVTVKKGKMTIHITLPSKNTVNLFLGTAEDAVANNAKLINPTVDTVTYGDGTTDEVNGFDIPVPYFNDEFDCALVGTKGKWYDHKVSVSNPVSVTESGSYTADVKMTGGSGKASIESPAVITAENGTLWATIVWSSTHYEYMTIGKTQYDRIDDGGNSTFKIPIALDEDIKISALTTAMSQPHLIDYTLHFNGESVRIK